MNWRPYNIDEYAIEKLIKAHVEAARTHAVAASGAPTILGALQELASQSERELKRISSFPDSLATSIRLLMCRATLDSIRRQITAWEKESKSQS